MEETKQVPLSERNRESDMENILGYMSQSSSRVYPAQEIQSSLGIDDKTRLRTDYVLRLIFNLEIRGKLQYVDSEKGYKLI